MFLESLIVSGVKPEPRRRWTTALSFVVQAALVGVLVMAPLLYTGALPPLRFNNSLPVPAGLQRPRVADRPHVDLVPAPSNFETGRLMTPPFIPTSVYKPERPEASPDRGDNGPAVECTFCVPGGIDAPEVAKNNVIAELLKPSVNNVAPAHAAATRPMPVSKGVIEGLLVRRVEPAYPPLAIATRVQGTVQLSAVIGKDGHVEGLQVISGHPLLVKAALDAVRQWRYRPYRLNGVPVEVEAQITVNFKLGS